MFSPVQFTIKGYPQDIYWLFLFYNNILYSLKQWVGHYYEKHKSWFCSDWLLNLTPSWWLLEVEQYNNQMANRVVLWRIVKESNNVYALRYLTIISSASMHEPWCISVWKDKTIFYCCNYHASIIRIVFLLCFDHVKHKQYMTSFNSFACYLFMISFKNAQAPALIQAGPSSVVSSGQ